MESLCALKTRQTTKKSKESWVWQYMTVTPATWDCWKRDAESSRPAWAIYWFQANLGYTLRLSLIRSSFPLSVKQLEGIWAFEGISANIQEGRKAGRQASPKSLTYSNVSRKVETQGFTKAAITNAVIRLGCTPVTGCFPSIHKSLDPVPASQSNGITTQTKEFQDLHVKI